MTNATVIIGLLVLLTFGSVSSPFAQEESSAFFADWYELQIEINSADKVLSECNELIHNSTKRQESLTSALTVNAPEDIIARSGNAAPGEILDIVGFYDGDIAADCSKLIVDRMKATKQLEVLDKWGLQYNYLQKNTTNPTQLVESKYHKDIASGPYSVNMINLAMIMPFLFSAIIDTIICSRKEKTEVASNIGIGLMVAGFVAVVVGLSLIGISFYQAAFPFL